MHLDQLLRYENGRKLFMEFLRKEFSEENLEFWLECQRLKNMIIIDDKSNKTLIKEIYSKYISLNGSKTINIDCKTLKTIRMNINNPTINIYDQAARHVFELMKNDSYERFLQTSEYRNFRSNLSMKNTDRLSSNRKRKSIPINPIDDSIRSNRLEQTGYYRDTDNRSPQIQIYQNSPILARRWTNHQFIKVIMPNGSHEFVSIIQQSTIGSVIENLLMKRSMKNYRFKIIAIKNNKEIEPTRNISSLVKTDIRIERVINFSLRFPEGYMLSIETNPNKLAYYTIKSILTRFGIVIHDVELTTENGVTLYVNSLLKSSSILDECVINVKYMSSLRTFLDLSDFTDLNPLIDDGIIIKSVKFKKYHTQKEKPFDFFAIDCRDDGQSKNLKMVKCENSLYENVDNNPVEDLENVNLENLSFSSETKTEEFLQNMMLNEPNRFKFTCATGEQNYENVQVKMKEIGDNDNNGVNNNHLHHARLVYIDEPFYENDQIIKREEIKRKNISKLPRTSENQTESPFTKYIQKSMKFSKSQCSECRSPPSQSKDFFDPSQCPDLISTCTPRTRIRTLSKFHKFV
ncbi:regulator of G-protein signaling loco [Dermatophagoides farinae]|uniref:regulator of G-protein signaling loco n=1 Tax=Dermatophagoides farinae TaxID=6954 RepID=UPI003F5F4431